MFATIANVAAVTTLFAIVGLGAIVTLIGAVVAVMATPGDRPIELQPRPAGIAAIGLGLLVFLAAAITLTDVMA